MDKANPLGRTDTEVDAQLNLTILRGLQHFTSQPFRHHIAKIVAEAVNKTIPRSELPSANAADGATHAAEIERDGFVRVGQVLTPAELADVHAYFESRPVFNSHTAAGSDHIPRRIGAGGENFHYGAYTPADVLGAPHLLELANRPAITAIAEAYLGCVPTLYSVNAWWSFTGHGQAQFSQDFHWDIDDYKFCTLFVYLTDVDDSTGPHMLIRQTHRPDFVVDTIRRAAGRGINMTPDVFYAPGQQGYGRDALYADLFNGLIERIAGPAGLGFIVDTTALHKGLTPTAGRRLIFWARYGLYRNIQAASEAIQPISRAAIGERLPRDRRTAFINRLLIRD